MGKPDMAKFDLASKECTPCRGGVQPLVGEQLQALTRQLDRGWAVVEEHHKEKQSTFDDFRQPLECTNRVGEMAESIGQHPDIYLTWGKCRVTVWTHKIDGLAEAGFIFVAQVEVS